MLKFIQLILTLMLAAVGVKFSRSIAATQLLLTAALLTFPVIFLMERSLTIPLSQSPIFS
jgi:hypothetical protein